MKTAVAILVVCAWLAGCTERNPALPQAAHKPHPRLAVTVYSIPPDKNSKLNDDDLFWTPLKGEYDYVYDNPEDRRVAAQVRNFQDGGYGRPYGIGVVKEIRDAVVPAGRSEFVFDDVAAWIEPDTVHFNCLTAPRSMRVLEQNYEYDTIQASAVLEKYTDRAVSLQLESGVAVSGAMLCGDTGGPFVIDTGGDIELVPWHFVSAVRCSALPEGLITRPRLRWLIESDDAGAQKFEVAYRTRGLMWEAAYTAVLSSDEKYLDLHGTVTLGNCSGRQYHNAKLKLVAGEINLIEPMEPVQSYSGLGGICLVAAEEEPPRFEEKSFFEYHMYTLS
ncbi:MAG TPA: hypothetical protein ENN09_05250, partial [Planctomycetes bacterium]|nr:hypothetical protein [Planctomycetota bacterium]